jgi:chromosome segregation ATPase
MDLATLRAKMQEKRAAAERVANEEAAASKSLAAISEATGAAQRYAHEKAMLTVIDPTPEVQAEAQKAKSNLTKAFARETEIRDRLPLLSAARQKLDEEIEDVRRAIAVAENTKVADVLTSSLDQIDNEIVGITGRLLARAKARGTAGWDVVDLIKERIQGSGDGARKSLRDRIYTEAEMVRATIASGMA